MRRALINHILAFLLLVCTGCMAVPEGSVPEADFRLGEYVRIEGVDVSRMRVGEAQIVVEQAARTSIQEMSYTLLLAGQPEAGSVNVAGEELPVLIDVDNAVRQASYLTQYRPIGQEERALSVTRRLDREAMRGRAQEIAEAFYLPPVNATAKFDRSAKGMFTYTQSEAGRAVSPEDVLDALASAIEKEADGELALPWAPVQPGYTVEQAMADHQQVSTFETSYAKSPHNAAGRVHNIKKAAGLIDATVVKPGEEFDTNAVLGPRYGETGWKLAAGIREGKYEQEYGGGVCQVSSTLFNAVMMADLTITERRPHSWPLSYVDIGRDATISTGGPNFKFVNSGDSEIVVAAHTTENKTLVVSIYGRPLPNGMTIQISSKATGRLPKLGTKTLLDESLPYATSRVEREERTGRTSVTYKEYYDADGNRIKKDKAYEDKYRSIQGITYVSADLYYGSE